MAGALIVTAEMAGPDQAWLDRLRRAHFPPERNHLSAHLTMFHALPPSCEEEAKRLLAQEARERAPKATIAGLMNLGRGAAYRVVSADLDSIRGRIASHFHGMLTAQDGQGWRPHVTIQNKVEPKAARALIGELDAAFKPMPLKISGLGLYRYSGGPWEEVRIYPFRGV